MILRIVGGKARNGITSCQAGRRLAAIEGYFEPHSTSGAARHTGGLFLVHKFMKTVSWQRTSREGLRPVAEASARISRLEGMEGHARTADIRLQEFFPGEKLDLSGTKREAVFWF